MVRDQKDIVQIVQVISPKSVVMPICAQTIYQVFCGAKLKKSLDLGMKLLGRGTYLFKWSKVCLHAS